MFGIISRSGRTFAIKEQPLKVSFLKSKISKTFRWHSLMVLSRLLHENIRLSGVWHMLFTLSQYLCKNLGRFVLISKAFFYLSNIVGVSTWQLTVSG